MNDTAVLLIDCPDRKGLVASVASLLYGYGANITHADQHQDHEAGLFFMRVEWALHGFDLPAFRAEFESTAADLRMRWQLKRMSEVPRVRSSCPSICIAWRIFCTVNRPEICIAPFRW
jgi:formyltetrahydrofolate deformylase